MSSNKQYNTPNLAAAADDRGPRTAREGLLLICFLPIEIPAGQYSQKNACCMKRIRWLVLCRMPTPDEASASALPMIQKRVKKGDADAIALLGT